MREADMTRAAVSAWTPLRYPAYALMWGATVVTNIGWWMYTAAAGWLMTSLTVDPLTVSLVQVASGLPMFLLAYPAGALADIVDRRRLLIACEIGVSITAAIFAALVWLQRITPTTLLVFTFLLGAGAAVVAPAWQAIVPQLIPRREELPAAVALNSVGVNISRAIGPALGGVLTTAVGVAAPFCINAFANFGSIGALLWWRPPRQSRDRLATERFANAMRTGTRYARNNPSLRATLGRAVGFFLFASAYWALLPLVARIQLGGGPTLYGILLGAIGVGAIGGAWALPTLKKKLNADRLVEVATVGTCVALVLFSIAREPWSALVASLLAGACWIVAVSSLNVSAQFSLPEWVRARGLAIYVTVYSGALTLGSALWGQLARMADLPVAHFTAAAGAVLAIALMRRWKLQTAAQIDLTPSMHWPEPVVAQQVADEGGPVLVTVEYVVSPEHRRTFLAALERVSAQRRRDGAYAWGVFEDTAQPERFLETFLVESWLEHLRQHERVTNADRMLEEHVNGLLRDKPKVTHLITPA
jgi:MFS family permease